MAGALDCVENHAMRTEIRGIGFVSVGDENDIGSRGFHVETTHELEPPTDVLVNDVLDHGDDLRSPVMMEIAFPDELRHETLIYVVPVEPIGWLLFQVFALQ